MPGATMLDPAGAPADAAAATAWVLVAGATLVFAAVVAVAAWAIARRRRGLDARAERRLVVGGGVVFPAVVLAALAVYELRPDAAAGEPSPLAVAVTGHSWWWQVGYRDPASGREIALANEIRLPAGRAAVIGVNAGDVIHSFWVPALAGKVDAIPGRVQQLRVVPREPGTYLAPCAEFCGTQHAQMTMRVVVEPEAEFERWLAAQARPAEPPRGAPAERGRAVFGELRCAACHTVRGLFEEAPAAAAPDLTHVGSRQTIGAGALPADAAGFARWVSGVQHVKAEARMPQYPVGDRLDAASLEALAAFLVQLK